MHKNPFEGKTYEEIYEILMGTRASNDPTPRWPPVNTQASFLSRGGPEIVKLTLAYLALLEQDGAFSGDWKGLDYGCGFGRFASLMLQYGPPDRLDLADAMPRVSALVKELGLQNKLWEVPQIVEDDTAMGGPYSFAFSYSVFTHFNKTPFDANFLQLARRLRPGGTLYVTVRQADFLPHFTGHWFKTDTEAKLAEFEQELADEHFLYVPIVDHPDRRDFWGAAFVTPDYLRELAPQGYTMDMLGDPDPSQKLYALRAPR